MKAHPLAVTCSLALALALPTDLSAHGGQYTGPGDTVPPGGGGSRGGGPPSPGPNGPATSEPGGSQTPGPGPTGTPGPGGVDGPLSNPGGGNMVDLTSWKFWWGFNQHRYLRLKSRIFDGLATSHGAGHFLGRGGSDEVRNILRPSQQVIHSTIVPLLVEALETETNPDILTAALIALGKIGDTRSESGEVRFNELIKPHLKSNNQEVRETAAVSLGILASDESVKPLLGLLQDSKLGQELTGRLEVSPRTRAFAAYGLSLVGAATTEEDRRLEIANALAHTLRTETTSSRDLSVACLISLGLVPLEGIGNLEDELTEEISTRADQLNFLLGYLADDQYHYLVRAHVPVACARLIEGLPEQAAQPWKDRISAALVEHVAGRVKSKNEIVQGCILALGSLGDLDLDEADVEIREAIRGVPKKHVDRQSRFFAQIALASIGTRPGQGADPSAGFDEVFKALAKNFNNAKGDSKPWAALALGVLGNELGDDVLDARGELGMALRTAFGKEKNSDRSSALAISLGLVRDIEAVNPLVDRMRRLSDDEAKGYTAVGLGLVGDASATDPIREVVDASEHRHDLLRQAAIGLGLIGDKELVGTLVGMLEDSRSLATQSALASALGFIGDAHSIEPLAAMARNTEMQPRARAFALAALGIVAEKQDLPWNAAIAENLNYRAATATLNSPDGTGILNIL